MNKKIKVLVLADSPFSPSGVGMQTRYMIESLMETGRYKFVCLAGAIRHQSYEPIVTEQYGEDWVVYPVDDYGNENIVRSMLWKEKPDIVWIMTDPRFWTWLWAMENEIRSVASLVYYHVWDNYPYPTFNKTYYDSNDAVVTISKVTDDIVRNVSPDVDVTRLPHAVPHDVFKKTKITDDGVLLLKKSLEKNNKMLFLWNNRNARRKQSGTLIFWFKEFLDIVGRKNAALLMHTEPKDPNGQDLEAILSELGLVNGEVMISTSKTNTEKLAQLYNAADCTINISDAEGFGLATLESLSCETPIIVNMTGGLQEQVTDGKEWFGIGIEPSAKAVIGSQTVPWIYEDRICKKDFIDSMVRFYNMSKEDREKMGRMGREHVLKNYSYKKYGNSWDKILTNIYEKNGSWNSRKNYQSWTFGEVV